MNTNEPLTENVQTPYIPPDAALDALIDPADLETDERPVYETPVSVPARITSATWQVRDTGSRAIMIKWEIDAEISDTRSALHPPGTIITQFLNVVPNAGGKPVRGLEDIERIYLAKMGKSFTKIKADRREAIFAPVLAEAQGAVQGADVQAPIVRACLGLVPVKLSPSKLKLDEKGNPYPISQYFSPRAKVGQK